MKITYGIEEDIMGLMINQQPPNNSKSPFITLENQQIWQEGNNKIVKFPDQISQEEIKDLEENLNNKVQCSKQTKPNRMFQIIRPQENYNQRELINFKTKLQFIKTKELNEEGQNKKSLIKLKKNKLVVTQKNIVRYFSRETINFMLNKHNRSLIQQICKDSGDINMEEFLQMFRNKKENFQNLEYFRNQLMKYPAFVKICLVFLITQGKRWAIHGKTNYHLYLLRLKKLFKELRNPLNLQNNQVQKDN